MKQITLLNATIILLISCSTTRPGVSSINAGFSSGDILISESLFNDKAFTISEGNIQKIFDGTYELPGKLRVAIVTLEPTSQVRRYVRDEQYLKIQQSYLDLFSDKFKQSPRVTKISIIPNLLFQNHHRSLISGSCRKNASRHCRRVSIMCDIYSKHKFFSKADIKAFATIEMIILEVRTGLIPFSAS